MVFDVHMIMSTPIHLSVMTVSDSANIENICFATALEMLTTQTCFGFTKSVLDSCESMSELDRIRRPIRECGRNLKGP